MKYRITFLLFFSVFWNCKDKPEATILIAESPSQEEKAVQQMSPIVFELTKFADIPLNDSTEIEHLFNFKQIDTGGEVTNVDMNMAIDLYKKMMKREQATLLPIFEIKNKDSAILPVKGIGFGGAIWAKVMIDKNTLEIKKIEFDHNAESEGYGAAMTQASFEKQFIGTVINLEKNSFVLQKYIEKQVDDGTLIDGISGATMTSEAALEMVNEGLKGYKGYFSLNE